MEWIASLRVGERVDRNWLAAQTTALRHANKQRVELLGVGPVGRVRVDRGGGWSSAWWLLAADGRGNRAAETYTNLNKLPLRRRTATLATTAAGRSTWTRLAEHRPARAPVVEVIIGVGRTFDLAHLAGQPHLERDQAAPDGSALRRDLPH